MCDINVGFVMNYWTRTENVSYIPQNIHLRNFLFTDNNQKVQISYP